jgi:ElaB/YqjD/DUF883 family membrane-anchored ribosome-binding protein
VAKDTVLSRELKSLQEELSASHREHRPSPAARGSASSATTATAGQPEDTPAAAQLREELREFVNEITEFIEDAEKNVSAHPVLGAMSVGILIGYLIGRR